MAITVTHAYVSGISEDPDSGIPNGLVGPNEWNAGHVFQGGSGNNLIYNDSGALSEATVGQGLTFSGGVLSSGALTLATGNTVFYVSTTGSDANDGLSPATAFATIKHAVAVCQTFNWQSLFAPTIQVENGTYVLPGLVELNSLTNTGFAPTLQGNPGSPSSVILDTSGAGQQTLVVSGTTQWFVSGFQLQPGDASGAINALGGNVIVDSMAFGSGTPPGSNGIILFTSQSASGFCIINFNTTITLNDSTIFEFADAELLSTMQLLLFTLVAPASVTVNFNWLFISQYSFIIYQQITFANAGGVSGKQLTMFNESIISTDNGLLSDIPGTSGDYSSDCTCSITNPNTNNATPFFVVKSGRPTSTDIGPGTWSQFKDSTQTAGFGNFDAVNDAGTVAFLDPIGKFLVSALPTGIPAGTRAWVTDATAPAFAATLTGLGAVFCPVYYDGTNWRAG